MSNKEDDLNKILYDSEDMNNSDNNLNKNNNMNAPNTNDIKKEFNHFSIDNQVSFKNLFEEDDKAINNNIE